MDRLEDTITHFYNAINELRERVSTLEKKLESFTSVIEPTAGSFAKENVDGYV
jgi:cell division septum initiation protein DivIVA